MAGMTESAQYRLRLTACAGLAALVMSLVAAMLICMMFVPFG